MLFDEYIKIFEEILEITKKIEVLCSKLKSNEAEPLFKQRNELMQKLDVPDDIDDEKFQKILAIKEQITELNAKILKGMKKEKDKAIIDLNKIKTEANSPKSFDMTSQTILHNKFQPPKSSGGGSIFS